MQTDKDKNREAMEEALTPLVKVSLMIQMAINKVCKGKLKKGEVIVFSLFVDNQFMVWVYPANADLVIAEKLLATCLAQIRNTYAAQIIFKEDQKAKKNQEQYIS